MNRSTHIVSPDIRPGFTDLEIKKIEAELWTKYCGKKEKPGVLRSWWLRWRIAAEARRIFDGRLYLAENQGKDGGPS
jgi:hypothetical protein